MKELAKLIVCIALAVPATSAASSTPADFSYCADVEAASKPDALYQVHLSEDVIRYSGAGLEDLRLFDASGREMPFTIIEAAQPFAEKPEAYSLEITGYDPGPPSAIITMKMPRKHRAIGMLDLDIADRDFKKRVTLWESGDGTAWRRLAEDTIYDFTSQVNLRKTKVEFPGSDARFYRLALADDAPQSLPQQSIRLKYHGLDFSTSDVRKKELSVRAVRSSALIPAGNEPLHDRKAFSDFEPALDKDGNTVIFLEAGLPVDRMSFEVANRYYYRTVQLFGGVAGKEGPYRLLASGPIYRFPLWSEQQEEKNRVEPRAPKHAWYKIVVLNQNNPPLDVRAIAAEWIRKDLYFSASGSGGRYSLCFGNRHAARPEYDIARFVNRDSLSRGAFEPASLGAAVRSEGHHATLGERFAGMEKTILKAVVALLAAGMGGWLYALLKRSPRKK